MRLSRRYKFCASHRLHSDALSEQENRDTYGKCNNPHGHGHNYLLDVTVSGKLNRITGQVIPLADLDTLVDESILRVMDHRNLNQDVPEFATLVPTSENLAAVIEKRLKANWEDRFTASGARLLNVSLLETRRNRFDVNA